MRREIVIAGSVIFVLGTLFFAFSQNGANSQSYLFTAVAIWVVGLILILLGVGRKSIKVDKVTNHP